MNRVKYEKLGERVCWETLDNGLRIIVNEKPEFQKSYAFFATCYGGNDTRFMTEGKWHATPAGVAHFLEHKMFDTKDGNALQQLAANGASPNAFTSNAITGYFFECTDRFAENLEILLSFVSTPWFTQESVDKEQGIIGQEIRMIEDNPDWRVFMNLMGALYQSHPMRSGVAGTVESIAEITEETLYACHRAFYVPDNMVLCVAGPVDAEQVVRLAKKILPEKKHGPIGRDYGPSEPECAATPVVEENMAISAPLFQMGIKLPPAERGPAALAQKLLAELCCEVWLGNSSRIYAELYEQGLVNSSYSYGYEACEGCAFLCAGGESRNPKQVFARLMDEAGRIAREGIDEALWERLKRAAYGNMVRGLNSFQNQCVAQAEGIFAGYDYLEFPSVFQKLRREDGRKLISAFATEEHAALSVIWPGEGEV